jgi:hypothetical protein
VEPMTGIEPVNLFLTKEALYRLSYMGFSSEDRAKFRGRCGAKYPQNNGAGDEVRTRDIQLGRLKLYQLSYSRRSLKNFATLSYTASRSKSLVHPLPARDETPCSPKRS